MTATTPRPGHTSEDDPRVTLDRELGVYEPVPPYPPRTEREAEFYTLGDGEMFINMGPQHPSTHGVLRVVLKLDGEKVVDLDPVLGYLHRGVEKLCENADYHHVISQVDPLEYVSSLFNEWAPVMAFEQLLDVQVPRRAEYIRVLSAELNRIASHSLFLGWMALDLGGLTPILWSFIERDEIIELLASLTGQRMLFNYFRIGGVNGDLNHDFMSRLGEWMSHATEQIEAGQTLLNENEIFVRRMRDLGTIDTTTALRMCFSGPNLRATGVPFDVRRAHPYSVYPELDFDIPTRGEGDCLARYLLRMDEIKQSLRIIDQCLHQMPDGPIMAKLPRLLRPRPGRAYAAVEAPRGQYATYAISDGTHQPFRMRIHDPSFIHLQAVGLMTPGHLIADTMAVMASLDTDHGRGRQVTVIGKGWDRLTLPGKIVFTVIPLLLALTIGLVVTVALLGPTIVDILADNMEIVRFVVAVTIVLLMTVPTAFLIIYMEMKVIALMNLRIGPDRVGPFGSLLSVVHGLKVLMKEDFTPTGADTTVFTWAPVVVYLASVMTLLVIPFAPGVVGQDLNLGLLYFFAIGGLGVVGLLMGGWSSYNKYSLLGGLRSAAQVVSYEIPLTLSVVGLILLAGTMSLNTIVENQSGWFTDWYVFQQPLGALIFFIAATAEANRTPFDLTEADSEIVAGFATEYSGMRFGFFFFAEYVNVFIMSALTVTLFFGGWNAPVPWPFVTDIALDPASLGIGLLLLVAIVPVVLTLIFAAPFWIASSRIKWWQALLAGFVLANLFIVGLLLAWAYVELDWVAGILWFMLKTYVFVFTFVWMRGTLPRVRIDQLMDFAWKWLLPAALLNLFVTAAAIVVLNGIDPSLVPGATVQP